MEAKQPSIREFVVLSYARTGSSQLEQYINQFPKTKCFWEVFKTDCVNEPGWQKISCYFSSSGEAERLHSRSALQFWLRLRDSAYVKNSRVGAKIFYYHRPGDEIWNHLLSKEIGVIHLTRSSTFDSFVSLELAKQSGVWSLQSPKWSKRLISVGKQPVQKIHFDVARYIEYRSYIIQQHQSLSARLAGHPKVLNIEYGQISDKEHMSKILSNFLGVKSKLNQTLLKQSYSDALAHVRNQEDAVYFANDSIQSLSEARFNGVSKP